jgi:hypothetical protein
MGLSMSDTADYTRSLEAYLCRKNDGHLIRIVGPAFEQVCGWAARGIPLNVACRGVDRYFERYYAKGPRRRPVRIEFCEADVLDVFDEWRRAVGVPAWSGSDAPDNGATADGETAAGRGRRGPSLAEHLERVVARLTALRSGPDRRGDERLDAIVRELDTARGGAKSVRGDARHTLLARLAELDAMVLDSARTALDAASAAALEAEADAELAPFRERMPSDAYHQSRRACIDRLLRDRARLPVIAFE